MTARGPLGRPTALLVRRSLVGLTVITMLSTAFELATERHWHGLEQLIPWLALAVLAVATALLVLPGRGANTASRALTLMVLGASIYGVIDHIAVNYYSGPLDQRFADSWASMPWLEKWWYAITKTVGPSPSLAPGVLGLAAMLLLLASLIDPQARNR